MIPALPSGLVTEAVARALSEDLGGRGDVTTLATIPADATARFQIASRARGVLAGVQPAMEVFAQVDRAIAVDWKKADGEELAPGDTVAAIEGPAGAILTAERTALNFLGRLSGIASLTRDYAAAIAGTGAVIAHTRKTTPGLRAFELAAGPHGGGAAPAPAAAVAPPPAAPSSWHFSDKYSARFGKVHRIFEPRKGYTG